ncbi:MAG TPA: hypothetical protein VFZ66_13505 [Herpetosiphonaceae bacterium]
MLTPTIVPPHAPAFNPPTSLAAEITIAEVHSLALELCAAEGLTYSNALRLATDDLDFVLVYGESWDRAAFLAGNDDAMPF